MSKLKTVARENPDNSDNHLSEAIEAMRHAAKMMFKPNPKSKLRDIKNEPTRENTKA